jgi:septation ring formation regulator EzrA
MNVFILCAVLQADLAASGSKSSSTQQELSASLEQLKTLQSELASFQGKISSLQEELTTARSQLAAAQAEAKAAKDAAQSHENQGSTCKRTLNKVGCVGRSLLSCFYSVLILLELRSMRRRRSSIFTCTSAAWHAAC